MTEKHRREIAGYVGDWSAILPKIGHPVTLWHGDADNWAPPAMADALARLLPNGANVHRLQGRSHYTMLQAFLNAH